MHKMNSRMPVQMKTACEDALSRTSIVPDIQELIVLVMGIKTVIEDLKTSLHQTTIGPEIFLKSYGDTSTITQRGVCSYLPAMLKANAFHLEFQDQSRQVKRIAAKVHSLEADPETIFQLEEWWRSSHSDSLWIQESPYTETPSPLAIETISLAETAGLPIIGCFCERQFDPSFVELAHTELLIRLVYSLVYQLVHTFEEQFSSTLDLSKERFSRLDRDPSTIPLALELVEDLLSLKSGRLIIVIDGIQIFDDAAPSLQHHLSHLLRILQGSCQQDHRVDELALKTLYTTPGQALILMDRHSIKNILELLDGRGEGGYLLGSAMVLQDMK